MCGYVNMTSNNNKYNENITTVCEKFKHSVTESDAVHPRFANQSNEGDIENIKRQNDFFCPQCNIFFAPTVLGLREHFKPTRIKHRATETCIYCKGFVYIYLINENQRFYHDCTEMESMQQQNRSEPSEPC